ncbi:MAG: CRISPR-associated endoribonuclease Cas2 [Syntrophorhabdus sp. PtaU1.Bin002]|nr:MAG: CRISPR-associated endoribonuclease Cas2 [Syntrophorhabdus sp. PtaU1.Bin002]
MFYVISYDIPDDRKRDRIAKILLDFGTRVQYSVFECIMDDETVETLTARLADIVSDEDSVRLYALCAKCYGVVRVMGSGKVTKDEDVYIL